MEQYQDIEITCDCGEQFWWTAGEQKFMNRLREEGKVEEVARPRRCPRCREEKKRRFENKN